MNLHIRTPSLPSTPRRVPSGHGREPSVLYLHSPSVRPTYHSPDARGPLNPGLTQWFHWRTRRLSLTVFHCIHRLVQLVAKSRSSYVHYQHPTLFSLLHNFSLWPSMVIKEKIFICDTTIHMIALGRKNLLVCKNTKLNNSCRILDGSLRWIPWELLEGSYSYITDSQCFFRKWTWSSTSSDWIHLWHPSKLVRFFNKMNMMFQ